MFDEINPLIRLLIMRCSSHKTNWYHILFVTDCDVLVPGCTWGGAGLHLSILITISIWVRSALQLYVFLVSSLHMLRCPKMHCVSDCPARQVVQALHWSFIYSFWMPSNPLILRIIHHVDFNMGSFTITLIECIIGSIRFLTQPWCLNFIEFWLFTKNSF